jgi:hypothetical protein
MRLAEKDHIAYLSNLFAIAQADGAVTPKEIAAIEEIRAGIGAKKSAMNAAQNVAAAEKFVVKPLAGFIEQVNNIADMLFVAAIDGRFDASEELIVQTVCTSVELTQEQLRRMIADTLRRVEKSVLQITCQQCSTKVDGSARFCPSCGAAINVVQMSGAASDMKVPSNGYVIEFCESTAAGFPSALELAKQNESFQTCMRNKKTWYQVSWPETEFDRVLKLAGFLSGMRNRRCFQNGEERPWDEMFGCAWCVRERETAYRPAEYCFGKDEGRLNLWGCKQARMDWSDWAPWLSYGSFSKTLMGMGPYEWGFDKKRIRHELEANLFRFRNCPHLNFEFIEAVLEVFPASVCVEKSSDWTYSKSYEFAPGCIKIKEVEKTDFGSWTNEYFSDGMRPVGLSVFAEIIRGALAKVQRDDITPELLTGPR